MSAKKIDENWRKLPFQSKQFWNLKGKELDPNVIKNNTNLKFMTKGSVKKSNNSQ